MSIEDKQGEVVQELEDQLETMSPTSQEYKDLRKQVDLDNDLFSEGYENDDEDMMYDAIDRLELLAMSYRK